MAEAARSVHARMLWCLAHQFVEDAQRLLDQYSEPHGPLWTSQFRRAAFAIPVNIADGLREVHALDQRHFLEDALGALEESRYYLLLAAETDQDAIAPLLQQTEEMARLLDQYSCAASGQEE